LQLCYELTACGAFASGDKITLKNNQKFASTLQAARVGYNVHTRRNRNYLTSRS